MPNADFVDSIRAAFAAEQDSLRLELREDVISAFKLEETGIGITARRLDGAALALQQYIELGLPESVRGNDYLRTLLYGEEGLLFGVDSGSPAMRSLMAVVAQAEWMEFPDVMQASEPVIESLEKVILQIMENLEAGRFREKQSWIEGVLVRLDNLNATVATAASMNFGEQLVGVGAYPREIVVRNDSVLDKEVVSVDATGDFGSSTGCVGTLKPGGHCTVEVVFTPQGTGMREGAVHVATERHEDSQVVTLQGLGVWKYSGDVDGNEVVNCLDLAVVRAAFGRAIGSKGFDSRADVTNDGRVDVRDLSAVAREVPRGVSCQ